MNYRVIIDIVEQNMSNWRASEASETLSGVTNGNRRYIYISESAVALSI